VLLIPVGQAGYRRPAFRHGCAGRVYPIGDYTMPVRSSQVPQYEGVPYYQE